MLHKYFLSGFWVWLVLCPKVWAQTDSFRNLPIQVIQQDSVKPDTPYATDTITRFINEFVVTTQLQAVRRQDSPAPVEVYNHRYFRAAASTQLFDALQLVNGLRPQTNCNVCQTGDVRCNGLEGPYTQFLLDGMPMISALSAVYGLSGIPMSMIERIEVVKGPAGVLYGSESVGGLVNIISRNPQKAPLFSFEFQGSQVGEFAADAGYQFSIGKRSYVLNGVSWQSMQNRLDANQDGFTDQVLFDRLSLFQKGTFIRKHQRQASWVLRMMQDNRWGGQMNWQPEFRGSRKIYGESIQTKRWEVLGIYQLPLPQTWMFRVSANQHLQNSTYGATSFIANQFTGFAQLDASLQFRKLQVLSGLSTRYQAYKDNTPVIMHSNGSLPFQTVIPGIFTQIQSTIHTHHRWIAGARWDYHSVHGSIFTPRLNYQWISTDKHKSLRAGLGSGYRVVSVFTEDHAALTGARQVMFESTLKPERSWNTYIQYNHTFCFSSDHELNIEASLFYTRFHQKVLIDYDKHPDQLWYNNLVGYAYSRGLSLNADARLGKQLNIRAGATFMDVQQLHESQKIRPYFTEQVSGVWNLNYQLPKTNIKIDYSGTVTGPMLLPLLSDLDPRLPASPWFSIQNIQTTWTTKFGFELFAGIRNLLNWTPVRGNPFLIARAHDPFDEEVSWNTNGQVIPGPLNPYGLTFDPTYAYAPLQGRRFFAGLRYSLKQQKKPSL